MPTTFTSTFPLCTEARPDFLISDYIEFKPVDCGNMVMLKFARKEPVNYENLVYFCGGYIDPRTRNYYVCKHRSDAVFPLFTLDSVMPGQASVSAADLARMVKIFSALDETAFDGVWHENIMPPVMPSVYENPDHFETVSAVFDAIAMKRMQLNKLLTALEPYADMQTNPVDACFNYPLFVENLKLADKLFAAFMIHFTVLEMQGVYSRAGRKTLAAVFDFPLFEKVHGRLNYADREQLIKLWQEQRDGSLEDRAELDDDEASQSRAYRL